MHGIYVFSCSFLRERIHCKEALVSSACGVEAGHFAYSVVKLATEKQSTRHGCKITLERDYSGMICYDDVFNINLFFAM